MTFVISRSRTLMWGITFLLLASTVDGLSPRRRAFDDDEAGSANKKIYERMEALAGRAVSPTTDTAAAKNLDELVGEATEKSSSRAGLNTLAEKIAYNIKHETDAPKYGLPPPSSAAVQKLLLKVSEQYHAIESLKAELKVQGGGESPTPAGSDPAAAAATTPSSPASTANVADSAASSAAAAAAARSAKEEDAAHSAETAKLMEDLVAKEEAWSAAMAAVKARAESAEDKVKALETQLADCTAASRRRHHLRGAGGVAGGGSGSQKATSVNSSGVGENRNSEREGSGRSSGSVVGPESSRRRRRLRSR